MFGRHSAKGVLNRSIRLAADFLLPQLCVLAKTAVVPKKQGNIFVAEEMLWTLGFLDDDGGS
jgi:hypothetical protein